MSQYWRIKYEKEVKELLTISPKLKQKAENLLFKIAAKKNISLESRRNNLEQGTSHRIKRQLPVLVGIHVRRGDKAYKKWPLPGRNYFHRAMEYFRKKYKKVYFIVASTRDIFSFCSSICSSLRYCTVCARLARHLSFERERIKRAVWFG